MKSLLPRSPTRSRAEEEDAAQKVGEEHADDQQPLNNGPAEGGSDVEMVEADSQDVVEADSQDVVEADSQGVVEADSQDVESQGKPAIGDSIFEADGDSDCSDFEVEKDSKSLHC